MPVKRTTAAAAAAAGRLVARSLARAVSHLGLIGAVRRLAPGGAEAANKRAAHGG